jgi:hypothetical protein
MACQFKKHSPYISSNTKKDMTLKLQVLGSGKSSMVKLKQIAWIQSNE